MKIEIKPDIGSYTEEEAVLRMAAFVRGQINKQKIEQKIVPIPELDKSPEDAKAFLDEYLKKYLEMALVQGAQIYLSVLGRLSGRAEAEEKLKK